MKWLSVFPLIGVSLLASDDHTSALSDAAEASTPAQGIDFSAEFLKPQLRAHDTASEERMDLPNIHFSGDLHVPGNVHIRENLHIPPGDANVLTRVTEGNPASPDLPVYHEDPSDWTYIAGLSNHPETSQLKTNPQSSEEKAKSNHPPDIPQSSEEKGEKTVDGNTKFIKEFGESYRAGVIKRVEEGDSMKRPRKRDSIEDDEDERALDAILIELGIPNHDKKIKAAPSASAQVIELITPPRNFLSTASREQSDGLSYVDLTASPASLSRSPSPPNVYRDTSSHTVAAVNDDEQQQDEVSFSYSPSECPPSYVYSLSPEPDLSSSSSSSLEVLSPELSLAVRRQVVANKGARTGAKQARRLSGRLRNLHSEATRGSRQGRDDKKVTIREAPTIAAALSSARTTTIPSVKSTAGASLLQSSTSGKQGQDGIVAAVIAVVQMEKSLDTSIAGEKIRKALKSHVYNGKAVPFTVATALKCTVPGVIRWERRGSGDPYYSCAIYYEAGAFLKVLQKKSYTELIAVVRYLQTLIPWMELQAKRPRPLQEEDDCSKIFIIVEGMDRALIGLKERQIQEQKKGSTTSRHDSAVITFADLQEVAFQLFMDMGTHTKFTSDLDDTADYIALLTRELVLASSRVSALEEFLEAVPRYNSFRVTQTGATTSACANAWLRMLLVIPGVSEDKAQCLLDHFPTFDSLMQAYRDPNLSRAQKQNLVADKLSDARIQRALSRRIYTVFCEENPDTLL